MFCYRVLTFFKINFFLKKSTRNTIRVSNDLDPDEALISVQTIGKGYQQMTEVAAPRKELRALMASYTSLDKQKISA